GGDGTFGHAFQTLAQATAADNANDTIFVYNSGSTYSAAGGITLESGEKLIGDGGSLTSVNGHTVGNSTSNATFQVTGNSTTAVTLNSGNTVDGINITTTGTTSKGIADNGGTVGTLHLSNFVLTTTGNSLDLANGGTVDATGTNSITSTGGA